MLKPLIATLVLTGLALANPLLEEKFWKTATPADVEKAVQKGGQGGGSRQGWLDSPALGRWLQPQP